MSKKRFLIFHSIYICDNPPGRIIFVTFVISRVRGVGRLSKEGEDLNTALVSIPFTRP